MRMDRTGWLLLGAFLVARAAWPQGMPVGPEFRVNTSTAGSQGLPSAASSSSGDFVVVWTGPESGYETGIFGQRYDSSGAALGPEFHVNTFITSYQAHPAVAFQSSDDFVVVWTSNGQDGSATGVFGQRYVNFGPPLGPEFRVNTFTPSFQENPSVASDASGNVVVVWTSDAQDGSFYGVFGQRLDIFGTPLGPEFRVNTYTTGVQQRPSVASDAAGNFVVVWESYAQDGRGTGIFGQRFASSGAPLGPEFRVNTFTPSYQRFPSVASGPSGNFVVVWASYPQDGSGFGIFAQRYDGAGAPLGSEFRVNTYATGYQVVSSLVSDSSGNFVVVWDSDSQDGSAEGVYGQRYDSSGAPLGPEFRVNTYTTSNQVLPVASDSSGNFVVVWQSYGQDGSGGGVFGQRYGQIVPVGLMRFGVE
jgi:hypothetical protein